MVRLFARCDLTLCSMIVKYRLQDDILLTHSAPAVMRKDPDDANAKETYLEPGELTIWRWLSMFRFFPVRAEEHSKASLRPISSV